MSTIEVTNFGDKSISVPATVLTIGSPKSWASWNGVGTVAIRDSYNASSLTDNGTGNQEIGISNNMASVDYAAFAGGSTDIDGTTLGQCTNGNVSASVIGIMTANSAGTATDWQNASVAAMGDLA